MLHQDLDYEYTVRNQKENSSPSYCCLDTTVINGHKLAQRLCRISLLNLDPLQQQHNKLKFLHYHHTKHTQERVNNSDISTFFEVLFASNKRFLALPFTILTRNYPPFTFPSFAPPQPPPTSSLPTSHLCLTGPEREIHGILSKMTSCFSPRHRWQ